MRERPINRFSLVAIVVVGLCLIVAGIAAADVLAVGESTRYTAKRGSNNLPNPQPTSIADCDAKVRAAIEVEGSTRTAGGNTYQCITTQSYSVLFKPAPVVVQPVDCVVSDWGPPSDPPWLDCAGGQQTRAVIRRKTILTQPANGGAACPSLVETRTETRTCAALSWTPPTQNTDGSALTTVAGYRVVYGLSPTALTQVVQVASPSITAYTVSGLAAGTWYFAVKAHTSQGVESALSNIAQKTVQ